MAVRIARYGQRTSTPTIIEQGGDFRSVSGPDVGGALMNLAGGIAQAARSREAEKESIGASWATERMAALRSEYARKRAEAIQNAGPGGSGVVDFMNSWIDSQAEALEGQAPTEKSREFLKNRLADFRSQVDINAFEYEQAASLDYRLSNYDSAINNNASAAAQFPGSSMTIIAETRAAILADPTLTPEKKQELVQRTIESVSIGAVIGDIERDPSRSVKFLRALFGVDHEAEPETLALQMESATAALEELERAEGIKVHSADRQAAIAALMREGGDISFKDGRLVVNDQQDDSDIPAEYVALPLDKRVSLLSQAETALAKAQNQNDDLLRTQKTLFRQELNNRILAARSGEPVQIPDYSTMVEMLGEGEAIIQTDKLRVLQGLAPEFARMDRMTNAELMGMVAAVPTGTTNREFNELAYNERVARIKSVMAAREADPGGYVVQNNGTVQTALANVSAATDAASQDPSPENMAALSAAQSTFVATTMEAQRSLGIETPKLPEVYVRQLQTQFTQGMASNNPQAAAMSLNGLAQMLIDQPEAIGQLAEATGVLGEFAIDGVDGLTIKRLEAMYALKESQIKELLPPGTVWGQLEDAVNLEFAPLTNTLLLQGGKGAKSAASRYMEAGQRLTAEGVSKGMPLNDAAREAYRVLVDQNNYVEKTYRIPKAMTVDGVVQQLDRNAVVAGLGEYIRRLSPGDITIPTEQGVTTERSFERKKRTIMMSGQWVNNGTGDGVFLMHDNGPVLSADGMPVEVKFIDSMRLGTEVPAPPEFNILRTDRTGNL